MSTGPDRPVPSPQRIVLTGFMGAGKSTVGRILAARLGWRFLDIDTFITAEQRLPVAEIFARHGETHFRALELEATRNALETSQAVIALGGGAIESDAVRDLLFAGPQSSPETDSQRSSESMSGSLIIFLEAPLDEMLARCRGGVHSPVRPLLTASESPEARWTRRLPHYRRAHLTVHTSARTPDAVVDGILAVLPAALHAKSAAPAHSSTNGATP